MLFDVAALLGRFLPTWTALRDGLFSQARNVPGCAVIVIGCPARMKEMVMPAPGLSLAEEATMLALEAHRP
jgi:hypothetical protein